MKKLALMICVLFPMVVWAKAGTIGYELLSENQDSKAKTYSLTFAVWSVDKDAKSLKVTGVTDSPGLELLTPSKSWSDVKRGQRKETTFKVRNAVGETRSLILKIERIAGGKSQNKEETRTEHFDDSKEVSVMVPAP